MTRSNSLIRLSFKARLSRMIGVPRLPSLFALRFFVHFETTNFRCNLPGLVSGLQYVPTFRL